MVDLPERMNDVTRDWLQGALEDHPAFRDRKITAIRKSPIGVGIGQMSELARVELDYEKKRGPKSVVVKLHAPFQAMRDVGVKYEMFSRETAFYESMACEVTVPIPTIYFVAWDQQTQRNATIMQDMSDWYWPDQLTGPTKQQAEKCVDALAQLGAKHWDADFSAHPWLPDSNSPLIRQAVEDYRLSLPVAFERCASFVTPEMRAAGERIERNIDWICAALAEPPLIVAHYDCRLENFVFADKRASKLALIDWQLVARLRPGWDIAYFTGTSLPEETRGKWQKKLRDRYRARLKAGGVKNYSSKAADYDFRLASMAMTMIPVIGGASFDGSNERNATLFGTILRRSLASVIANDCLAILPA